MAFNHLKRAMARTALKADQIKTRARYNLANSKVGVLPVITAVTAANLAGSDSFLAFAKGVSKDQASTVMGTVINVVVAILGVVAAIAFLWGLVDVSAANMSENGGPQKEKGQKKFIAAIICVLVAVGLKNSTSFFMGLINSVQIGK